MCEQCLESLNRSYSFKCKCLETEKLIANYLGEINATVINLKQLKTQRYKDDVSSVESSIEIKEICDNYEDFNISGIQTFVDVEAICTGTNETDNEDQTQPELNNDSDKASTTLTERQISSQPFTCDICNKIFTHRHQLTRHQLTHKKKEFICDICKKGFTTQYDLKRHAKTHIKTRELNKCPTCLKLVQDVSRHIQSCHQHKHVCDICGAKFGFNSNLIDHKRTHTGDRPYRCEMCGKGFAQTSTLYLHIRSIHTNERPHICQTCGKGFTKPAEVRRHELVHIPNREKKFVCESVGCNKAFTTKRRRQEHMKRHFMEKNFRCDICDKAFLDNHDLQRHIKIHTGEKPFECNICCKRFGQGSNLRVHLKSHRPNIKLINC